MNFTGQTYSYGLVATGTATGVHATGLTGNVGTPVTNNLYAVVPDIVYSLALQIAAGATLTWNTATGAVTGTISAVAASLTTAITGSNNDIVWTARTAGTPGNSITITYVIAAGATVVSVVGTAITVTCASGTLASAVRTAVSASTAANALVSSANAAANDGSGAVVAMSTASLSGGVTASIAYRISGTAWDAKDAEGIALASATNLYSALMKCDSGAGATINVVSSFGFTQAEITPFASLRVNPSGNHPWTGGTVAFTPDADVLIYLDVHAGT